MQRLRVWGASLSGVRLFAGSVSEECRVGGQLLRSWAACGAAVAVLWLPAAAPASALRRALPLKFK